MPNTSQASAFLVQRAKRQKEILIKELQNGLRRYAYQDSLLKEYQGFLHAHDLLVGYAKPGNE